jgi:alkyl hydroperoxide reductase subunit F
MAMNLGGTGMLDHEIVEQLRKHFADLGAVIELVVDRSTHGKQQELLDLLNSVAAASSDIVVQLGDEVSAMPRFAVKKSGVPTGIVFQGIPGGHEFTSFVLAILNSAGKGKMPDGGLAKRIRSLKGPARIRTFVSLSCENCPEVVQALNQVALIHGAIEHSMVDGEYVQEELAKLGVQGVPSVYVGDDLIHSGKATLAELLEKLEAKLGLNEAAIGQISDLGHFDVAVLGGGPAGASAAIYSVRKGLKTILVAAKLGGQVQETKGIENLISVIYTEGPQLAANLEQHLRSYPISILEHRQVQSITHDLPTGRKDVLLSGGERFSCASLIIATGAKWRELGVPGEKEYIGRGVAFCPHCDGPYYKGKRVAVVGGGNSGVEAAIDLAGICAEITLFEYMDRLKADDILVRKLKSLPNVHIVTNAKTTAVVGNGDKVISLGYQDRVAGENHRLDLDGIFVQIGLSPNSDIVKGLVEVNSFGEIIVDAKGRTSVPGIYAAGDVTTVPFKQIVIAMGEGSKAALTAFEDRMRAEVLPAAR